jgi:hypothetical protein
VFFHKNGKIAAREVYNMDQLVSREYYSAEGTQEDSTQKDLNATFPGGEAGWRKFMYKHIFFPPQYQFVNGDRVTVVVTATIDEEGNVVDPFVEVPFNRAFDNIAITIFKRSPKGLPAMRHNRAIVQSVRQPITFAQTQ